MVGAVPSICWAYARGRRGREVPTKRENFGEKWPKNERKKTWVFSHEKFSNFFRFFSIFFENMNFLVWVIFFNIFRKFEFLECDFKMTIFDRSISMSIWSQFETACCFWKRWLCAIKCISQIPKCGLSRGVIVIFRFRDQNLESAKIAILRAPELGDVKGEL